jgi:hypothetical protein
VAGLGVPRFCGCPVVAFIAPGVVESLIAEERHMAFVTADVVPNPEQDQEHPFKVVFKQGEKVLVEWPVESKEEGEQEILDIIGELAEDDDD